MLDNLPTRVTSRTLPSYKQSVFDMWWDHRKLPEIDMSEAAMGRNRPHVFELKLHQDGLWVDMDVLLVSFFGFERSIGVRSSMGLISFREKLEKKGLEAKRMRRDNFRSIKYHPTAMFIRLRDYRVEDDQLWLNG